MKRAYHFVNESIEIEITEYWHQVLRDLDRQEYNNQRKETRRHCSLEALDRYGDNLAAEEDPLEARIEREETVNILREAVEALEAAQQELLREIYVYEKKQTDMARELGVSRANIAKRLKRIYRRLEKNFGKEG